MSNPYSSLKVFHHRERLDILRAGGQPVPSQVQLILSDLCQQSCHFCAYRWEGYTSNELFHVVRPDGSKDHNPNRMISTAKALEVLNDCKNMGVGAVQFTGGGEPTLHPQHLMIFDSAIELGLKAGLVTNGVVWRQGIVPILSRFAWVRFSIDAGSAETYSHIRGAHKTTYDMVHDHVIELVSATRKSTNGPLIGVGFVVTAENWTEVVTAANRARDAGAHNFRISAVFQPEGKKYFHDFYNRASVLCRDAELLARPGFTVANMFGERLEDLEQAHPDYSFCGYQHFTTYIGGDMNVYRCCNLAYNPRGLIGSIRDQSFRELWESEAKRSDFAQFDATGCPRCQFNNKNRVIHYALENDPTHVDFV